MRKPKVLFFGLFPPMSGKPSPFRETIETQGSFLRASPADERKGFAFPLDASKSSRLRRRFREAESEQKKLIPRRAEPFRSSGGAAAQETFPRKGHEVRAAVGTMKSIFAADLRG